MKLQIEKAVYGGAGLAHQTEGAGAGQAVFVPFALPGELVEVHLQEQKEAFGQAFLVQVLTASEDRVQAKCAHFENCGGCQYQNATYSAQVQMKCSILRETLERVGLTAPQEMRAHSGEPWAYRNRTRLRLAKLESISRVGYNRRGSNEFLAIHECPILAPLLCRATEAVLKLAAGDSPSARWLRGVSEVEFFSSGNQEKLQTTFFVAKERTGLRAFCERMQDLVPELAGAGATLLSSTGSQPRPHDLRPLEGWGTDGLIYRAADEDYWVNRGSFFQVNRFLIDELVRIVTLGRRGAIAWDLYAGVGLFSRVLARTFQQVVAVEAAANELSKSFKGPGKRAVASTTAEFLGSAVIQRDRPDLIVMDPPRAGVGLEVCNLLARISAPEIVYVSCDPVTLARDLKALAGAGYSIAELHMVDMFPQTFHLEAVAVLRK
jgi:23S rRNA (uracil1939-C5)-methyltransferase